MQVELKQRIESVINNINQLPAIPDVVSKVITMVNDPNVAFNKVAEEICKDQSMTTNILKLCNSAYFSQGKQITSIERAIVTLGLKEVKDIVVVAATKAVMDKSILGYDLPKGELWRHGLAVAMLSKKIAIEKKKKDLADTVFTGGLIHGIGKTVLALYINSAYKEILKTVQDKGITFQMAEKEVLGYDHQEIGEKILTKWNFPDVLKAIVRYHLEPDSAPEQYKEAVSMVHVANGLCLMAGIGVGADGLYYEISSNALQRIGLSEDELNNLFSSVPDVLNQAQAIM